MVASRSPLVGLIACATAGPASAQVDIELAAGSIATSNVFADRAHESDIALGTGLTFDYGLAQDWALGYAGDIRAYLEHSELTAHGHELLIVSNPTWGHQSENDLWTQFSLSTLRNDDTYASLNLLRPALSSHLSMEPFTGLQWGLGAQLQYRWYYDEGRSDSFDGLVDSRLGWTFPTRTTVIAHPCYGVRRYTEALADDSLHHVDQQFDAQVRVGQGLWKQAGLQLDYRYRLTAGHSGLLQRKLTETQFQLLGDSFLYRGHRGRVGLKQILGRPLELGAALAIEERRYGGWPALDGAGRPTGEDRRDVLLQPRAYLSYEWVPGRGDTFTQGAGLVLAYQHTRQSSNSYWRDTTIEMVAVDAWSLW